MAFQLSFDSQHKYANREGPLNVRTILSMGAQQVHCVAAIDTGATVCLFQREIGEALDLDLEAGPFIQLSTLTGTLRAYGHEVTLQTFDVVLQTTVYFSATHGLERNLLGRIGWLQQVKLGIVDHDERIYLNHYDADMG
jgi:hypothetical protein